MHFSSLLWSSSTAPGHSGDHYIHQQGATLPSQDQTSNSGRWKEMRQIKKKENVKAGKRIGTVQFNKTEIRTVLKWQTIHLFSLTSAHPVVKNKSCFVFLLYPQEKNDRAVRLNLTKYRLTAHKSVTTLSTLWGFTTHYTPESKLGVFDLRKGQDSHGNTV